MKQSQFFTKTQKDISSKEELAKNYELLVKAGFINQEMAGVYSFLPLGLKVITKISQIIKQEIEKIGAQEILMPSLHPKINWSLTGRWQNFDVLFKVNSRHGLDYALGPTHEEIVVPLASRFISSYKDLPKTNLKTGTWSRAVYQIQSKFRDEKRAKSGLLRGREFLMKDLYSFHQDAKDLSVYYKSVLQAYRKIFKHLGLKAILTEASGGTFSKLSHEFQVECQAGEDIIYYCKNCKLAYNREIINQNSKSVCSKCGNKTKELKTVEIGNIFKLNTKFSQPFFLKYTDKNGNDKIVYMGCYGIGISRLIGVMAEIFNDDAGLIWPKQVAPFLVHLILLSKEQKKRAEALYQDLLEHGIEILFDDRTDVSAAQRLVEADLIGCPYRLVISKRAGEKIEFKEREKNQVKFLTKKELLAKL